MPLVKEIVVMAALLSDQTTFEQHAGRPPVYPVSNRLYGIALSHRLFRILELDIEYVELFV